MFCKLFCEPKLDSKLQEPYVFVEYNRKCLFMKLRDEKLSLEWNSWKKKRK